MAPSGKDWVDVLAAFSGPAVALAVGIVALLQYQLNRAKHRHDLFDRRYAMYEAIRNFIGGILTSGKATTEKRLAFLVDTNGARFVFDKTVTKYIEEIHSKAVDLHTLQSELEGRPQGDERTRNVDAQRHIKDWFSAQLSGLEERFSSHLDLKY
jgi:hypothetical protein